MWYMSMKAAVLSLDMVEEEIEEPEPRGNPRAADTSEHEKLEPELGLIPDYPVRSHHVTIRRDTKARLVSGIKQREGSTTNTRNKVHLVWGRRGKNAKTST
jgi:hypothetical protein